ncbi:6-phosphogluconolactonase [Mycetocola manganoxydans]|uniref:6-phosphogluconolactonase n=1 Tax=Mycetocola manganoxydans TaxID=699879 RepID=A0A3L6ZXH4_9MICO|nr:6-phosphogluconolactonase [Mycetocola manganoxydans]RLP72478.1 6-phosphogluconolactonase [Mycetocola manganoxydans]GHD40097.1 6-phosphogluconolactonase [Mycetocola manganoxydans]
MTNERRVLVHADSDALAASMTARFLTKSVDLLDENDRINVVLEGGRVALKVLAAINASPARDSVDWERVHFWWGDERWLPAGDPERNDRKAREALLDHIEIPGENIHSCPASDGGLDLDAAAAAYAAELAEHADGEGNLPRFDITFLGVGPDGHTASLFPDRKEVLERDATVVAVRNSPKPPAERISLTRPAINSSHRIWVSLSGADKASVLGLALAGAAYTEVPIAGMKGRKRTVFFVDADAASEVPENLIARSY